MKTLINRDDTVDKLYELRRAVWEEMNFKRNIWKQTRKQEDFDAYIQLQYKIQGIFEAINEVERMSIEAYYYDGKVKL